MAVLFWTFSGQKRQVRADYQPDASARKAGRENSSLTRRVGFGNDATILV